MRTSILLLTSAGLAGAGALIAMEQGTLTPRAELSHAAIAENATPEAVFTVEPVSPPEGENQVVFATQSANRANYGAQMRQRLADPEEWKVLRAEMREMFERMHPGVAEALDLDAATHAALIDLITDHHMTMLDESFGKGGIPSMQARVQAETKKLEDLRAVLGEGGVERFQEYQSTLGERSQVDSFDKELDASEKLDADQKRQLIALYKEKNRRDLVDDSMSRSSMQPFEAPFPDRETMEHELRRRALLDSIEANTAILRRMGDSNRWIAERAAAFLTPTQVAVLKRRQAAHLAGTQYAIEEMRVQAGLDRKIPDADDAAATKPLRRPIAGHISYAITFTLDDAEPLTFNHSGPNREPATFKLTDDLSVETMAVLFDDRWFDAQLTFVEHGPAGARRLAGGHRFGQQFMTRNDIGPRYSGTEFLVTGRKVYAVKVEVLSDG